MRQEPVHLSEQPSKQSLKALLRPDINAKNEHIGEFADDAIDPFHQRRAPESRHGKPELFRIRRLRKHHCKDTKQQGRRGHAAAPRHPFQTAAFSRRKSCCKAIGVNGA